MTNAVQSPRTITDRDTTLAWEDYETQAAAARRQYQAGPNVTRDLHAVSAGGVCVECARRAGWS